ncbi:MAG: class II glutamine amidotransferase [Candidatus Saccharibacteria bacterium]
MMKEGAVRIPSGCAIAGIVNRKGELFSGIKIWECIATMRDRSNGLGGGFGAYGIYPEYKDAYALHVLLDGTPERREFEQRLRGIFGVLHAEPMPVRNKAKVHNPPAVWRYFVTPNDWTTEEVADLDEFTARLITQVNAVPNGAFIVSWGKNMGVFKGVGFPEDIAEFYRLEDYKGHTWTAHGRFPTNTPGWWGGAHPFGLLDLTVVHNGEISSYDANRRYLEMFGYICSLQTDTEVITYAFDWMCRKQGLTIQEAVEVVAPPLWSEIDELPADEAARLRNLRSNYGSLLLNGPFSIVLACADGFMALNDRLKLRPMVAAESGDYLAVASEESAIRTVFDKLDRVWSPRGGEPVWGWLYDSEPPRSILRRRGRGDCCAV